MAGIFCENEHLVLNEDFCRVCGWVRPAPVGGGQLRWGPIRLPDGLAPIGLTKPAATHSTAVFPLQDGRIAGLHLGDGRLLWETSIGNGLACGDIRADGDTCLCAVSDVRPIGEAGEGFLARIDTATGSLTPVWQAGTSKLGDMAVTPQGIYLRTSRNELLAFDRSTVPKILWRTGLETFLFAPPAAEGGRVVVQDGDEFSNEGRLKSYRAENGSAEAKTIETRGVVLWSLARDGDWVFYREGSRELVGVDLSGEQALWTRKFKHMYTEPVAGQGRVFLVIRWKPDPDSEREYRLVCLDGSTGETQWETRVTERVSLAPAVCRNQVVLGSEKGTLFAYDSLSGELLWQQTIGSGGSPVQARLITDGRVVLGGTRAGEVIAVSLGFETDPEVDPEKLLANGEIEAAGEALALQGRFKEAADLYFETLKAPDKALALLEHAGLHKEAGELAEQLEMNTLALDFYRQAGDPAAEAIVLVRMGDHLKAAQILEETGDFDHAAKLYERSGDPHKALEIYKRLQMMTQVARLSELVSGSDENIAFLEEAGRLTDAARVAEKHARLRKAVDLYRKAQAPADEYRVLRALVETGPEEWSLERLSELAVENGDLRLAAETLDQLKRPRRAAAAYFSAAREMEAAHPDRSQEISQLYELSMLRFTDAGLSAESNASFRKLIYHRQLPYIEVRARMEDKFREDEINEAVLEIENTGMGLAYDVQVRIGGERFEVDETTGSPAIKRLASQSMVQHRTYLRPKERQFGGGVPLHLSWSWADQSGTLYQNSVTKSVEVRRRDDSDVSRPLEIEIRTDAMATSQELHPSALDRPFRQPGRGIRTPQPPVKVLYLAANPANMTRLSIDAEFRAIKNVVATLPHPNRIDLDYRGAVQTSDLHESLLAEKPAIVHFSGHGGQGGAIYIEDRFGDGHPISSRALGELFGLLKGNIRLVLLNACYSEEQAVAIAEHIDCVVGMTDEIEDEAARAFSTAFYRAIGFGTNVETAFNLGCNAIDIENLDDVNVPKIHAPRIEAASIRFFKG